MTKEKNRSVQLKRVLIVFMLIVLGISLFFGSVFLFKHEEKTLTSDSLVVIAHAGGGLDGKAYLNVQESFLPHYNNGTRYFEYDLAFSDEGEIIGVHEWEYQKAYSFKKRMPYQTYIEHKIAGKYTGVTLDFILGLVQSYPDIKIILDTKEASSTNLIKAFIDKSQEKGVDIFGSVIPQLYSEEMIHELKDYPFKEFIFTNYKSWYSGSKLYELIKLEPRIKILVMPHLLNLTFKNKRFSNLDVKIAVHTLNTKFSSSFFLKTGVDMIYSDFLFNNTFTKDA